MLKRELHLSRIGGFYDSNLVKILVGIRGAANMIDFLSGWEFPEITKRLLFSLNIKQQRGGNRPLSFYICFVLSINPNSYFSALAIASLKSL